MRNDHGADGNGALDGLCSEQHVCDGQRPVYDLQSLAGGRTGIFDYRERRRHLLALRSLFGIDRTPSGGRLEASDAVPADAPQFVRDYHAYYKTSRGYHARSLNSTQGWNATSNLAFLNAPILAYAAEIRSAVMVVHGEKAHSRYMGEDAFKKLQGDNKRLLIVPGANHTDLYDKMEIIPFDEIAAFYREYLK